MTPAQLLRMAADACEDAAIGERSEIAISLLALHILRVCGGGAREDEARLLMRLLDG